MSKLLKIILSCSAIIAFGTTCNSSDMNQGSNKMEYRGYPSEADYLLSRVDITLRDGIKNTSIKSIKAHCNNVENLSEAQKTFESYCIGQYCNPLAYHRSNSWIFDVFKHDKACLPYYELVLRFFEICNRIMDGCFNQNSFAEKYKTSFYSDVFKDFSRSAGSSGIANGIFTYLNNVSKADRSEYKISSEFMKNIKQIIDNITLVLDVNTPNVVISRITESKENSINIVKNFNVIGNEILQLQNNMYVTLYKLIEEYAKTSQDTNAMKELTEKVQALILPGFEALKEVNQQLQALKREIQTINTKQPLAVEPKLPKKRGEYEPKYQIVKKYCEVIDYINSIFENTHIQNVFKYYPYDTSNKVNTQNDSNNIEDDNRYSEEN